LKSRVETGIGQESGTTFIFCYKIDDSIPETKTQICGSYLRIKYICWGSLLASKALCLKCRT